MGTDNLHHKRKTRDSRSLHRKKAKRAPYDKVLIVCEGEKTEPNYLKEMVVHFRLNTANVEVTGDCGSSPIDVYTYALHEKKKAINEKDPYDRVFCVFDKDAHSSYETAKEKAKKNDLIPIFSVPCFEFWLLLHYEYTVAPFSAVGSSSICNEVIKKLQKYYPDYRKGDEGTFHVLLENLQKAIFNAKRVWSEQTENDSVNPITNVHTLVEYLQDLKD